MIAVEWNGPVWLQVIVFAAVLVGALVTLWRYVWMPIQRPISRRVETALGNVITERSEPLKTEIAELRAEMVQVNRELSFNGGGSVKDAVFQMRGTVDQILELVTTSDTRDQKVDAAK